MIIFYIDEYLFAEKQKTYMYPRVPMPQSRTFETDGKRNNFNNYDFRSFTLNSVLHHRPCVYEGQNAYCHYV